MIVVNLKGGLGNQMFQYAFGLSLAHKYGSDLKLDLRLLRNKTLRKGIVLRNYDLDIFSIPATQATAEDFGGIGLGIENLYLQRLWLRIYGHIPGQSRVLRERRYSFDERNLNVGGNVYIDGYWQSEKYFKDIETLVRERFVVIVPLAPGADKLLRRITSEESVCVNIRRGDFVNHSLHKSLETEYYERAVVELTKRIGSSYRLFVFSDDEEWCRENLRLGTGQEIVGNEFAGPKFSTKFSLMSACKHFIIPNSTFAWWAAWLAKNENKVVIGPKRWFDDPKRDTSDVLPESWVKV
ncbi:O-antigen biosynthesis glycosyltransferase WbnK [subsurface metagenome]